MDSLKYYKEITKQKFLILSLHQNVSLNNNEINHYYFVPFEELHSFAGEKSMMLDGVVILAGVLSLISLPSEANDFSLCLSQQYDTCKK